MKEKAEAKVKNTLGGLINVGPSAEPTPQGSDVANTPAEGDTAPSVEDLATSWKESKRVIGRGRPPKYRQNGPRNNDLYVKTSIFLRKEHLGKLKEISYRENLTLKELIESALTGAIRRYEGKHGELVIQDHRGDAYSVFD